MGGESTVGNGNQRDILLDEAANELYAQLSGIDSGYQPEITEQPQGGLLHLLDEEEKLLDHYRTLLLESVSAVTELLLTSRLSAPDPNEIEALRHAFLKSAHKLCDYPNFDSTLLIRFQGRYLSGIEERDTAEYDFEVTAGNLVLNQALVKAMAKRGGSATAQLPGVLQKSFAVLRSLNITSLKLDFKKGDKKALAEIAHCLETLCRYYRELPKVNGADNPFIVFDEYDRPNPDLTMLAAFNRVKPPTIRNLVFKVKELMNAPDAPASLNSFITVFDALFAFKNIKAQLTPPPVEVNNTRCLMGEVQAAKQDENQTKLCRLAIASYGESPQKSAEVINSIDEESYRSLVGTTLQNKLSVASDFVNFIEKKQAKAPLKKNALSHIEKGLEVVSDETFAAFNIAESGISLPQKNKEKQASAPVKLHKEILSLFSFFKRRSLVKKKMRQMPHHPITFDEEDFSVMARNFRITVAEAKHLVKLLRDCFDDSGRFRRAVFEKNIPEFIQYEKRVFEFLWHYLKEIMGREDRVSFLNALQHLIAEMQEPQRALTVILKDLFLTSHDVSFSDRNGLILANILIRKYNQELGRHIELTPEEVLLIKSGLNEDMQQAAKDLFELQKEDFYEKIRIIHTKLRDSITGHTKDKENAIPSRYLITLERELIIFISLAGGPVAHKVIQGILSEYSNPQASIYTECADKENLRPLLQLLQVSIRGLRRFGIEDDLRILREIDARSHRFEALLKCPNHTKLVLRVLEWTK